MAGTAVHSGHIQLAFGIKGHKFRVRAHVLMWELVNGCDVPRGEVVMHTCDNPRCVNPSHLRLGTQADNVRDSIQKGRYNTFGHQKLNAEDVREIRRRVTQGQRHLDVAKAFGVSRSTVTQIITGATWGHVPPVNYRGAR